MAGTRSLHPTPKNYAALPRSRCERSLLGCQYGEPLPLPGFHGLSEVIQKEVTEFCNTMSLSEAAIRELSENITAVAL